MEATRLTSPEGAKLMLITLDNPPVNGLGHALRERIVQALDAAESDDGIAGVVMIGAGRLFCAGADVREFSTPASTRAPDLRQVLARVFACRKPVIAAIHGAALGGGLELAMACHYRVADPSARLGLPEVNLGLIPGAWGTQLLPRLTGMEFAAARVTRGDNVPASEAAGVGLVDALADVRSQPLSVAAAAFFDRIAASARRPDTRTLLVHLDGDLQAWQASLAQALAHDFPGCPAPLAGLEAVALAASLPFDEAVAEERKRFVALMSSPESRALRHVFFAERECARVPGVKARAAWCPVALEGEVPDGTQALVERLQAGLGSGGEGTPAARLTPLASVPVLGRAITVLSASLVDDQGGEVPVALALRDGRIACLEVGAGTPELISLALGLGERLGAMVVCTPAGADALLLPTVGGSLAGAGEADTDRALGQALMDARAGSRLYRPADGDVIAVHGFGYPRYLGGPLYQADLAAQTQEVRE